jgi:hypothetical protein
MNSITFRRVFALGFILAALIAVSLLYTTQTSSGHAVYCARSTPDATDECFHRHIRHLVAKRAIKKTGQRARHITVASNVGGPHSYIGRFQYTTRSWAGGGSVRVSAHTGRAIRWRFEYVIPLAS